MGAPWWQRRSENFSPREEFPPFFALGDPCASGLRYREIGWEMWLASKRRILRLAVAMLLIANEGFWKGDVTPRTTREYLEG